MWRVKTWKWRGRYSGGKGYVDDTPQGTLSCGMQYFPRLWGANSQPAVKSGLSSLLLWLQLWTAGCSDTSVFQGWLLWQHCACMKPTAKAYHLTETVDNLLFYLTHVAITWEACCPKFQREPSTVTRPKRALSGHYSLTGKRWDKRSTKGGARCDCWESFFSYSSSNRFSWFYMAIYVATHHHITKSSLSNDDYS